VSSSGRGHERLALVRSTSDAAADDADESIAPLTLARRKRSHDVADRLEHLIKSGTFPEGERLPSEADLSRLLNVGRPSVREALFMLQLRGFVEVSNGQRAKVTTPTADFLIAQLSDVAMRLAGLPHGNTHLEQTRLVFESGLAWIAAQNATAEEIELIREALAQNVAAQGDTSEFIRTDVAFHYEIARVAKNPIFDAFHNSLVEWLINQRTTTINMPEADSLSVRDHTAIFEAIAARDPARAYHAMASHLRLVSRLGAEAVRLHQTLLRKVTRDIAARMRDENAEIWRASFRAGSDRQPTDSATATPPEDGSREAASPTLPPPGRRRRASKRNA
jgi:DNA-binding FadR family transcriptional regulator